MLMLLINLLNVVEIYPREGTETLVELRHFLDRPALKFIPVRGRKLCCQRLTKSQPRVEIYPREGTETYPLKRLPIFILVEIYPREGTETFTSSGYGLYNTYVEIYPREGTET